MNKYNITTPCLFGMEKALSFEIKDIGGENIKIQNGRIDFTGTSETIVKSNIALRLAERVLINLGSFKCETFDDLFNNIKNINYKDFLNVNDVFTIAKVSTINSKLTSTPAIQSVAKKAMAESLMKTFKTNILTESSNVNIPFTIFINKNIATLYIDTSGESLHKRGYRKYSVAAPLKETIAAFMAMSMPLSKKRPIYDIFTGSGTIPIEIAMVLCNIKPGINRNFKAETFPFIDKKLWNKVRSQYLKEEDYSEFKITAVDIDKEAIKQAKENASLAGVEEFIDFKVMDFKNLNIKEKDGFIISNPPYGIRISHEDELKEIYKNMKKMFSNLNNFSYMFITPDEEIGKKIGIYFQKNRKIYNGKLKTHIYKYLGEKPDYL